MIHDTDEVFAAVESGFGDIDLGDSLESVIARGRRVRDRRRMRTGLATMGVAAIVALAVALPSAGGSSASGRGVNVQMAGWSVHTSADSKVTLTMHDLADPDQVRKALAEAGITAHVRVEKIESGIKGLHCEPASINDYVPVINDDDYPMSVATHDGTFTATIDPALMPNGAVFSLIIFDYGNRVYGFDGALFKFDAPVNCVSVALPTRTSTGSNAAVPPPSK